MERSHRIQPQENEDIWGIVTQQKKQNETMFVTHDVNSHAHTRNRISKPLFLYITERG